MADQKQSFWGSFPGILTGGAAVITALTGLFIALDGDDEKQFKQSEMETQIETAVDKDEHGKGETRKTQSKQTADIPPSTQAEPLPSESTSKSTSSQASSLKTLIDCTTAAFQSPNTVRSLMGWSDYYHKQIEAAEGVHGRASYPCKQTITYRAQAHCKDPDNLEVRQALFETISLCREAGITVAEVTGE